MHADGAAAREPPHVAEPGATGSVGVRLRVLRVRAGLSQSALAARAGVDLATVKAIERDRRRRPHPHTLALLADALGLPAAASAALLERAFGPAAQGSDTGSPAAAGPWSPALVRLPAPPTPLIGRETDVVQLRKLLDPTTPASRLLTLVGPGGVGKTRLAIALAADVARDYGDGVVF
ncbi:MAG: XRE family transcriptional regulator, partial [Chloroflexi bacterium]|nr:XRE family transcriptional regulator [Chloroflexota bacterium]